VTDSAISETVLPAATAAGGDPLVSRAQRDRVLFERYRDPGDRIDRDAVNERNSLAHQLGARSSAPASPSTTSPRWPACASRRRSTASTSGRSGGLRRLLGG
jgi:hypothetical protein